jgi:erythronate-4-phosphate dehydrogenase
VRAVSRFFGLGIDDWTPSGVEPPENPLLKLDGAGLCEESVLAAAVLATYEIERDDKALRRDPERFEQLRGDYPVRREFDSYSIEARRVAADTIRKLGQMGFNVRPA